jgi:MscS family membrane protein
LRKNNNVDIVGIDTMEKVIKITTIVLWIFSILNQFGVQLSALLTFGGIGGIAIGLAGKDLFANIFGGLIIYLDKPFSVGDYIISDTNSIKGIVEYIGWRQTKVVTASNNIPQYIPNSILAITTIQNRSRVKFHKFNEIITIMYKDFNKAEEVMKDITNLLKQNKHINKRNLPSVLLEDLRKNLSIQIIMTTNTSDYLKFLMIRQNILLDIFKLMGEKKIEIVAPDNYVKLENITN